MLDLGRLVRTHGVFRVLNQIVEDRPQVILVKSWCGDGLGDCLIKYRDLLLANSDWFIDRIFKLKAYQQKARTLISNFARSSQSDDWRSRAVILTSQLLHLVLTESGEDSLWVNASQFNEAKATPDNIMQLRDSSRGKILISQDTLKL